MQHAGTDEGSQMPRKGAEVTLDFVWCAYYCLSVKR